MVVVVMVVMMVAGGGLLRCDGDVGVVVGGDRICDVMVMIVVVVVVGEG